MSRVKTNWCEAQKNEDPSMQSPLVNGFTGNHIFPNLMGLGEKSHHLGREIGIVQPALIYNLELGNPSAEAAAIPLLL